VERIADRIAVIHEGRVLLTDEMDRLREGACRLLVTGEPEPAAGDFEACIRAETMDGATSLTFLADEETARATLEARGGLEVRQAAALTFEDLFVDLVGGGGR
jgi:hypothetical protein